VRARPASLGVDEGIAPAPAPSTSTERKAEVRRAVASLSAVERQAVELHYFRDLELKDIAALLGRPIGTIKSRLSAARAHLRAILTNGAKE
jgi:RNA polymerase sigma-70 factor (ECF subfamily)